MNPWIQVTGWTLVHFVWQGALLAVATAVGLRLCRRRSSQARYAVACIGLAAMLLSAAATAAFVADLDSVLMRRGNMISAIPGSELTLPRLRMTDDATVLADGASRTLVTVDALLPMVVWVWMAGVALLLARFSGGCWRIRRLRLAALRQAISPWQSVSERLAKRLRVDVAFRVVESKLIDVPIVIGWIRPVVLLPVAVMANLAPGQIEALLAHELAHIRRRDYAVNLLQTVAEALLFFHPGVWWVSSRIRQEREHCCDDAAVEVCGEPTAYAEALAELASWRTRETALSLGAADGSLLARIRRLVGAADEEPRAIGGVVVLALGAVAAAAIAIVSAPSTVNAQPPVAPAQPSAENRRVRHTDHFEIHYSPDLDLHAERVGREAERAYEQVSVDLRHNLAFRVPIILYRTTKALEESVQAGTTGQAHAASFADPSRHRLLFAVDQPADQWFGLITHEVTHIFGFDIIPGTATPRWITEGLAEYERGAWDPRDLIVLRDAVRTNAIPKMSGLEGKDGNTAARLVYGLGHAAFDFIESRWGKQGVRQFLLSLRQTARSGGDPYPAAFELKREEFEQAFQKYLRERFAGAAEQGSPGGRFDLRATVEIEGDVTAIRYSVPAGLACLELLVGTERATAQQRWAVECVDQAGDDLLRALKPGDRVVVTGAPALKPVTQRIALQGLVRPADGFRWVSAPRELAQR